MIKEEIGSYEDAVDYLIRIPRFTSKNTMEDTRAFLKKLGSPDQGMKIIHVAGTNGKGSVCAYLCAVLKSSGYKTCLFTSPHLTDIRERFVIDGKMVEKEEFLQAFLKIYENISWMESDNSGGYHPTFFEYLFFMAMLLFKDVNADYCILETGLGGRLDATNAVSDKIVSIITHIGLDHTQYLGDTLSKIAEEKAGIMHTGAPVVCWETNGQVVDILTKCANKLQIPSYLVSKNDYTFLKFNNKSIDFSYHSLYYDSIRLRLNTIARYQMENVTLALRALEIILGRDGFFVNAIRQGVEAAFWAGRMEEIMPGVYADGAHNGDGVQAFLETVSQDGCLIDRHLLFGVVDDKDYAHMIEEIVTSGLFTDISVVQLESERAVEVEVLQNMFDCAGININSYRCVKEAFKALLSHKKSGERIYIAGSLYLIGEIKELL